MENKEQTFTEAINQVIDVQKSDQLKDRIINHLNLKLMSCDEEGRSWAEFLFEKQEMFLNPYGGVHGGIACVLADTCMGITVGAASEALPSTTDLQVSYLSPMQDESFIIHADIKRSGRQLAGCTCEIREYTTGKLCITSMGKYLLVRKDILTDKQASKVMKETWKKGCSKKIIQ